MDKMIEAIKKLLRLECEIEHLRPRPGRELLFTLSPKAYKELNDECNAKRLGARPCQIHCFCSEFGATRILEGKDQSDDILAYYRFG